MNIIPKGKSIDIKESLAFISVHVACLLAFYTGVSWVAFGTMIFFYLFRAIGITAGYHRYFSHRSYKTGRVFQFILGFIGTSAAQLGPIWWAGHHRDHHRHADTKEDIHSPVIDGFLWSHVGWILCKKYVPSKDENMTDFDKYPEIRFLNKFHFLAPLSLILILIGFGYFLQINYPSLGTSPLQMVVWGFFISTVVLYHITFCANSVAHMVGKQRFKTKDQSRNNFLVAIITLGEGWHNNHHRYPFSERQGFFWWEIDMTHYILKFLSWFNIVWDINVPPESVYVKQVQTVVSNTGP